MRHETILDKAQIKLKIRRIIPFQEEFYPLELMKNYPSVNV